MNEMMAPNVGTFVMREAIPLWSKRLQRSLVTDRHVETLSLGHEKDVHPTRGCQVGAFYRRAREDARINVHGLRGTIRVHLVTVLSLLETMMTIHRKDRQRHDAIRGSC